jgi:gas vesicle protein
MTSEVMVAVITLVGVVFTGVVGVITALLAARAKREASEANYAVNRVKSKKDGDPEARTLYDLTWENHQKIDGLTGWREEHLDYCREQCDKTRAKITELGDQIVELGCPLRTGNGGETCDDASQFVDTDATEKTPQPSTSPVDSDFGTSSPQAKQQRSLFGRGLGSR